MPGQVHILTDNTAQFIEPGFKGHQLVTTLPLEHSKSQFTHQGIVHPGRAFNPNGWGKPPSVSDFEQSFLSLRNNTRDVLVLTAPQSLGIAFESANRAAAKMNGNLNIRLVDSFTTAAGLGWLVQLAARYALEGMRLNELERFVRFAMTNVYTLLCIPEMSYLAKVGYLSIEQAQVGEILGMVPIFTIEDGHLSPLSKARTTRHILEAFQEFVNEFENPQHVIYIKPNAPVHQFRTRALRDFTNHVFDGIDFKEMAITASLAACIGPQSSGLVVVENSEKLS